MGKNNYAVALPTALVEFMEHLASIFCPSSVTTFQKNKSLVFGQFSNLLQPCHSTVVWPPRET